MRSKPTTLLAVPMLALALSACAKNFEPETPLAVRADQSKCPAYPLPGAGMLQRPRILDFLPPIEPKPNSSSATSSPPNRLSSSTP